MKINLISDVHAALDPKTLEVQYAEPQRITRERCQEVVSGILRLAEGIPAEKMSAAPWKGQADLYEYFPGDKDQFISCCGEITSALEDWDALDLASRKKAAKVVDALDAKLDTVLDDGLENGLADVWSWMSKTYSTFDPSRLEPADYLVIAGDLGVQPTEGRILTDIKEKTAGKFKDVLYVAGNHSHWWHPTPGVSLDRPAGIDLSRDYLEKEAENGWVFLGATMWTPIREQARWRIGRKMNDYNYVPGGFTPEKSGRLFREQSAWLLNRLEVYKDRKVVIVTHHQPFPECVKEDWKHQDVAEAYACCDGTFDSVHGDFPNVKAWLCGHTHKRLDEVIRGIRVVRNPIGYSDFYMHWIGSSELDPAFWYNGIIDLGD